MGRALPFSLAIAVLNVSCGGGTSPVSPRPDPTPPPITNVCQSPLSEYAGSRTYPADLVRTGVPCFGLQFAEERHCPGVYVAIAQGDRLILNTTRYFDGDLRLFAAHESTDVPTYCSGTSFQRTFGTPPTCPTSVIVTDFCRR